MLPFDDPKIKYLTIIWSDSNYYPVNKFQDDGWIFNKYLEDNELINSVSLSAYAIFKFLVYSKFIYSLKEIRIVWNSSNQSMLKDILELFRNRKDKNVVPNFFLIKVVWKYPNINILHFEKDVKYTHFNRYYRLKYEDAYNEIINSKIYDNMSFNDVNNLIYKVMNEGDSIKEIHSLIYSILTKLGHHQDNLFLYATNEWYFSAVFYSYKDTIYDWTVTLYKSKLDNIDKTLTSKDKIEKTVENFILNDRVISFLLGNILEKGTLVKRITYSNQQDILQSNDSVMFDIHVAANVLTIYWHNIDPRFIDFDALGALWPGLILRLEKFWSCSNKGIETLLKLVANGDGSIKNRKLMFSKIVFPNTKLELLLNNNMKHYDAFLYAAKAMYELHFDDPTILNCISKFGIRDFILRNLRLKANGEIWKFFSNNIHCPNNVAPIYIGDSKF